VRIILIGAVHNPERGAGRPRKSMGDDHHRIVSKMPVQSVKPRAARVLLTAGSPSR
jgi:hypothetical protein